MSRTALSLTKTCPDSAQLDLYLSGQRSAWFRPDRTALISQRHKYCIIFQQFFKWIVFSILLWQRSARLSAESRLSVVPDSLYLWLSAVPDSTQLWLSAVQDSTQLWLRGVPDSTQLWLSAVPDSTQLLLTTVPDRTQIWHSAAPDSSKPGLSAVPDSTQPRPSAVPDSTQPRLSVLSRTALSQEEKCNYLYEFTKVCRLVRSGGKEDQMGYIYPNRLGHRKSHATLQYLYLNIWPHENEPLAPEPHHD